MTLPKPQSLAKARHQKGYKTPAAMGIPTHYRKGKK
jgi:hypothetical protein